MDGVAPRAKMNQQRSRRFKSAKEKLKTLLKMQEKGELVPENLFDSNCITPGTEFMQNLNDVLVDWLKSKIAHEIRYRNCTVV